VSLPGPVHRVIAVLADARYEPVPQPAEVAGVPFEFAALLAGERSLDLVAIVDLALDRDDGAVRARVEGLAGALDLVTSRRALTVVLVGPLRGPDLVRGLVPVARVITVGTLGEEDDKALRSALSVLLPLEVATDDENPAEAWEDARARLAREYPALTAAVFAAAGSGAKEVGAALQAVLAEPLLDYDLDEDREQP
jgi:hypothetical protein